MSKDVRALLKRIEAAGGRVVQGKRNAHRKVYVGPVMVAVLPSTPSDARSLKNAVSNIRKGGLAI